MLTLMRFNIFVIFILIYGYIFTRLRKIKNKKMIKEYLNLSFVFSILFIISLTAFPVSTSFKLDFDLNIIPFRTILYYISLGNLIEFLANVLGNIIIFVPFGFFLCIKERGNVKITLTACLLFTICIETLQLMLPMRTTDIDDVILNFIGGCIGMILARRFNTSYENTP